MKKQRSKRLSLYSWCTYDWANSSFATVIITFVFSVYFARAIIGDETQGSAIWSYTIAFSGFFVALLSPIIGSLADHYGARKRFLAACTGVLVISTALLWYSTPTPSLYNIILTLSLVTLANIGFELGIVVYNAILPNLVNPSHMGRVSGLGWGAGYLGGLICLAIALTTFIGIGDFHPLLPLTTVDSANIRITAPFTALWIGLFSLPLFLWTHDTKRSGLNIRQALSKSFTQIKNTLGEISQHSNLVRFLIASMLYRDGLNTLFAVGGLYAAGSFDMSFQEILIFAIGLNLCAGIGAALFAFIDDSIGSKKTIIIALTALITLGTATVFIHSKSIFILVAMLLGIFIGPAQAASRTLAGRLTPKELSGQTYGFYAFTGKSTAFLGPLAFGLATSFFHSQRAGIVTILLFWLAGLLILIKVRDP